MCRGVELMCEVDDVSHRSLSPPDYRCTRLVLGDVFDDGRLPSSKSNGTQGVWFERDGQPSSPDHKRPDQLGLHSRGVGLGGVDIK